jgi:hypothetical protein
MGSSARSPLREAPQGSSMAMAVISRPRACMTWRHSRAARPAWMQRSAGFLGEPFTGWFAMLMFTPSRGSSARGMQAASIRWVLMSRPMTTGPQLMRISARGRGRCG